MIMDEMKKLRFFTIIGNILGFAGIIFLFLGSGCDKYTGYSKDTGVPYLGIIGLLLILVAAALIGYRIKNRK